MASDQAAPSAGSKTRNLKYSHRLADDTITEKFGPEARSVIATVVENGEQVETRLADIITDKGLIERLAGDYPIAIQAMLFGLKTTIGNALAPANSKGWSGEQMVMELQKRRATLVEDKEWREGGGGGPRTGIIIEAMVNIVRAQTGKELPPAALAGLKEEILAKGPKVFTDDPVIAQEIAAIEMRKAQEKLEARKQAAQGAQSSLLAGLASLAQ